MPCRALILATLLVTPSVAAAQEPDSLEARVEFLERMIEILQSQIAEQAGATVAPRVGARVELSGLILLNGFYNDGKPFMDDVPQFVLPQDTGVAPPVDYRGRGGLSAAVRQTRLSLRAGFDNVAGATLTTELDLDFFGGQHPSSGGRTFPNLRIRRTRAQLDWRNVSVMFGQEAPPIVEINPSSVAAMGYPGFSGAGNLWLWLPQARLRLHTSGPIQFGVEATVLAPSLGEKKPDPMYTEADDAEASGRPFFQGRAVATWGDVDFPGEASIGAHVGWIATPGDTLLRSEALAVSTRFAVNEYVEVRGEAFTGQILRTLGGGGVYQNRDDGGRPVETTGGWAQINVLPNPFVEFGAGYGRDDPTVADPALPPHKLDNEQWEVHLIWRPAPLLFGFEFRRMETTHSAAIVGRRTNNHLNVALGFEF